MKNLLILSFLMVTSVYAHSDGQKRTCLAEHLDFYNLNLAKEICENVSTTCYISHRKHVSLNQAANYCRNIADTCYNSFSDDHSRSVSRKLCFDVDNACFQYVLNRTHSRYMAQDKCKL